LKDLVKENLVAHLENIHEYSKETSEKLSCLAFELAIRRRQEAASKARRLSIEIQTAQLSKSPKKPLNDIDMPINNPTTSELVEKTTSSTTDTSKAPISTLCSGGKDRIANNQGNVTTVSPCASKVEILYKCPVCKWAFRGSLFWRHIAKKHPGHKIDKDNIVKVGPAIDQQTGK